MAADRSSHILPLAPPQIYRRSDDKWDIKVHEKSHDFPQTIKHRKTSKCFVYLFTLTVLLCLAVLIFATVVLRAAHPKLRLESVHVNRLTSLNLTAAAELKLSNGNFGRFRFRTGTVSVVSGNRTLGRAEIENGVVLGRKSATINAVVRNLSFVSETGSDEKMVKMKWFAELRGEVRVVKMMSSYRTSFMNCSLSLNLSSKAVQDLLCY